MNNLAFYTVMILAFIGIIIIILNVISTYILNKRVQNKVRTYILNESVQKKEENKNVIRITKGKVYIDDKEVYTYLEGKYLSITVGGKLMKLNNDWYMLIDDVWTKQGGE